MEETKSLKELLSQKLKTMEGFENVDLDDQEIELAILDAKRRKVERLENIRKEKMYQEWEKEMSRPWSAEELFKFCKAAIMAKIPDFRCDKGNKDILKALSLYFSYDQEFESTIPDGNLKKGLCFMGGVGVGKTTLMQMFSKNKRQSYRVISCREVAARYADHGHEELYFFSQVQHVPFNDPDVFFQRQLGFCFDDLGTEQEKKNFGNQVNVMQEVILNRYDNRLTGLTHITTNLSADEIEQYYGTRVRSRMREMFNMISISGNDRRK